MPIYTPPRPSSSSSWTDRSAWGPSLYTPADKARIEDRLNNLEQHNHALQSTIDSQHDLINRLLDSRCSLDDRLDRLCDWNADDARNIADLQIRQLDQQRDIRRMDNNSNTDDDRIRRLREEVSRLERDVGDQIFLKNNNHVSLPSSSATTTEQVRTATMEFTADNSHTVVANDHPGKRKAHHDASADNDRRPPPPPPVQTVTITNGGPCIKKGTYSDYGGSSKRPRRAYTYSPPSSPLYSPTSPAYSPTDPHYCDRDSDDHSIDSDTRTRYPRVYSPLYHDVDDHSADSLSLGSYPNAAFKHIPWSI